MLTLWRDLTRALGRRLRPGTRSPWGFVALGVVLVTEVFGRRSANFMSDTVWSVSLVASLAVVAAGWGVDPSRSWWRLAGRWSFVSGVDLRCDPPLPEGAPQVLARLVRSATLALVPVLSLSPFFPARARELALTVSPTLYFGAFAALWTCVLVFGVAGLWMLHAGAASLLHDRLTSVSRRLLIVTSALLHFLLTALAVLHLPVWAPFAVLAAGLVACALFVFAGPRWGLRLVWRERAGDGGMSSSDAARLAWGGAWLVACTVLLLTLPTLGEHLWTGEGELSVSATLGLVSAWLGVSTFGWVVGWQARIAFLRTFRNPAVPRPVRVVVLGELPRPRPEVAALLRRAGFAVGFGDRPHSAVDVPVRLLEPVMERPERWALPATLEDLAAPRFHFRLRRRGSIRRRRQFLHGLHRMWREACRGEAPGLGFWVAPHLWFVTALTRDPQELHGPEDALDPGVPFHRWMPLEARVEVRAALAGAELDLVFVERGVSSRGLRRVFEALFEHHDLFGGQRRAEERSFVGIPGVRVVIHEHRMSEPAVDSGFPEPDYAILGRARILHVAREEGGKPGHVPDPEDRSDVPFASPGSPRGRAPLVPA